MEIANSKDKNSLVRGYDQKVLVACDKIVGTCVYRGL